MSAAQHAPMLHSKHSNLSFCSGIITQNNGQQVFLLAGWLFCHVKCHHFIYLSALIFICVNHHSWRMKVLKVTATFWTASSDRLIVESRRRCVKYLRIILKSLLKHRVHKIQRDEETSTTKDLFFFFYSGKCKFWRRSCMQNKSLKTQHCFWIDEVCKWVTNERKIMTLSALSGRLQGEEKVTYR